MTGNSSCRGSNTQTAVGTPLTPFDQINDSSSNTSSYPVKSNKDSTNLKEGKNPRVVQMNPEEVNGTPQWTRLNDEMLEHYYQKSIEEKVYKRKYDEAAYVVYGTIPNGVDPVKFREKMTDLQKEKRKRVFTRDSTLSS
nr:uncharacterized protein LOC131788046 [Pocillopora verrucosa]